MVTVRFHTFDGSQVIGAARCDQEVIAKDHIVDRKRFTVVPVDTFTQGNCPGQPVF